MNLLVSVVCCSEDLCSSTGPYTIFDTVAGYMYFMNAIYKASLEAIQSE